MADRDSDTTNMSVIVAIIAVIAIAVIAFLIMSSRGSNLPASTVNNGTTNNTGVGTDTTNLGTANSSVGAAMGSGSVAP